MYEVVSYVHKSVHMTTVTGEGTGTWLRESHRMVCHQLERNAVFSWLSMSMGRCRPTFCCQQQSYHQTQLNIKDNLKTNVARF